MNTANLTTMEKLMIALGNLVLVAFLYNGVTVVTSKIDDVQRKKMDAAAATEAPIEQ